MILAFSYFLISNVILLFTDREQLITPLSTIFLCFTVVLLTLHSPSFYAAVVQVKIHDVFYLNP